MTWSMAERLEHWTSNFGAWSLKLAGFVSVGPSSTSGLQTLAGWNNIIHNPVKFDLNYLF